MKLKRFDKRFLPMLWIGLGLWVGSMGLLYLLVKVGMDIEQQDNLIGMGKMMFRRLPVLTLLLLCFLQPVLEEVSFRLWGVGKKWMTVVCLVFMAMFTVGECGLWGVLLIAAFIAVWVGVKDGYKQTWLLALISSTAFMLCHISGFSGFSLGAAVGLAEIFGIALVCCWLTINISFWLAALLHVVNNSVAILLPMLLLHDPVEGSVSISVGDAKPQVAFKTVIEPLHPLADNSRLLEGATPLNQLDTFSTDFYVVAEPAELVCRLAEKAHTSDEVVLYDWESRNEGFEERVVLRVSEVNPSTIHNMEDLMQHCVYDLNFYLDDSPLVFDTAEVMLKEVWIVYNDGREEPLTDSCKNFSEVASQILHDQSNVLQMLSEVVSDSAVQMKYYCRKKQTGPLAEISSLRSLVREKKGAYDYRIDYRDGRKVKCVTVR